MLAHRVNIKTLAISPDGKLLLSGDNTGIAKVWSLPEAKWLHTFRTGGGPIIAADFDNDRHVLTVISSRYVNQWSTDDWKPRPRKKLKAKTKANAAVISRDHGLAILGTTLGELDFLPLDATTKAPAPKKIRGAIHDLLISADGDLLVINASSKVVLYSLPDIKKITSIAATGTGSVPITIFGRRPIAVSPEERFLAVASSKSFGKEKGKISLWELPDDALQAKLKTLGEQAGPTYSFATTEAALHKGALAGKEQVKALSFFSGGPFLVAGGKISDKGEELAAKTDEAEDAAATYGSAFAGNDLDLVG